MEEYLAARGEQVSKPIKMLDFDKLISKKEKYKNVDSRVPQWPFRLLAIGPSGSGKTTAVMTLITQFLYYDNIFFFYKDEMEDKYEWMKEFMKDLAEARERVGKKVFYYFGHDLEDIPPISTFTDLSLQTLMVFDDFLTETETNQKIIKDYFTMGRKRNISTIYITQSFYDTPKIIRKNVTDMIVLRVPEAEVGQFHQSFGGRLSRGEFINRYKQATRDNYGFLYVNRRAPDDKMFNIGFS